MLWFPALNQVVHLDQTRKITASRVPELLGNLPSGVGDCRPKYFSKIVSDKSLSYINQSIDLQNKSVDWFLDDSDHCH